MSCRTPSKGVTELNDKLGRARQRSESGGGDGAKTVYENTPQPSTVIITRYLIAYHRMIILLSFACT